ncbi:MAG TPA: CHAD domain-containing protein [Thermoanaerobaculia bacterium]|nr:CHAD domain-containing protein [Thermoanaerobaculia bacterium]
MKEFLVVEAGERAPQRLRRKALDLTDDAIAGLDQIRGSDPAAIHAVRRRLKELRALTRILGTSSEEGFFRDAGRELAAARDAKAALEAFDKLQKRFKDDWKPKQFQKIRRSLSERVGPDVDAATIERLRGGLIVERGRIAAWTVDEMRRDDLWDAVARSYRRARRGMRNAVEERTPAAIHEWRKRVKMHWYHDQFLAMVNLARLEPQIERLRDLSRTLGEHHDVVLVSDLCRRSPELFGSTRYVKSFQRFIERWLTELEDEAEHAGGDLFAEKPKAWIARVREEASSEPRRIGPKKSPRRAPGRRAAVPAAVAGHLAQRR